MRGNDRQKPGSALLKRALWDRSMSNVGYFS